MTDLVGRHHELGVLAEHLDEAIAGRGSLVLVAGEPGIGKTASQIGSRRTLGTGVASALGTMRRSRDQSRRSRLDPGAPRLAPEHVGTSRPQGRRRRAPSSPAWCRNCDGAGTGPSDPDGDESQFRLVEEVGHTLARAASAAADRHRRRRPAVVRRVEPVGPRSGRPGQRRRRAARPRHLSRTRNRRLPSPTPSPNWEGCARARSWLAGLAEHEVRVSHEPHRHCRPRRGRPGHQPRTGGATRSFVTELSERGEGADRSPRGAGLPAQPSLASAPATREILDVAAVFGRTFRVDWLADASHRPRAAGARRTRSGRAHAPDRRGGHRASPLRA